MGNFCKRSIEEVLKASREGNIEIVTLWVNSFSDDEKEVNWGGRVLMEAASFGHFDIVCLLVENGATINATEALNYRDETALICASNNSIEYIEIVEYLLRHGADVNAQNYFGMTALHYAAKNGHINIMQILIQYNANINIQSMEGSSPLMEAIVYPKFSSFEFLLKNNADITLRDKDYDDIYALVDYEIKNNAEKYQPILNLLIKYCGARYKDLPLSNASKTCYNCKREFKETDLGEEYVLALQGKNLMFCNYCFSQMSTGLDSCIREQAIANAQIRRKYINKTPSIFNSCSLEDTLKRAKYYDVKKPDQLNYLRLLCYRPNSQAIIDTFKSKKEFNSEFKNALPLTIEEELTLPYIAPKPKPRKRTISIKKKEKIFAELLLDVDTHGVFLHNTLMDDKNFILNNNTENLQNTLLSIIERARKLCFSCEDLYCSCYYCYFIYSRINCYTPTEQNCHWRFLHFFEYLVYKYFAIQDFSNVYVAKSVELSKTFLNFKFSNLNELFNWFIELCIIDNRRKQHDYVKDILQHKLCHDVLYETMRYICEKANFKLEIHVQFPLHTFDVFVTNQFRATMTTDFCLFYETETYRTLHQFFCIACRLMREYSKIAVDKKSKYEIRALKKLHFSLWPDNFEEYLVHKDYNIEVFKKTITSVDIDEIINKNLPYLILDRNSEEQKVSMPVSGQAHSFNTYLAGINYNNESGIPCKKLLLQVSDRLDVLLVREPENPYDVNAIKVYGEGVMLGYVPKTVASEIAEYLDRGVQQSASLFINRFDNRTGLFIKPNNIPHRLEYASVSTKLNITIYY